MKKPQLLALLVLCAGSLQAQPPIKSVDQEGNITYSDKPAADAVSTTVVPMDPGPGEEEMKAAQERVKKTREEAEKAAAERKALEEKRAAEKKAAQEQKAARPEVIIIQEESGYPAYYRNPPLITPRPPGTAPGKPDHPVYKPRPPVTTPVIRPR
ncbi:hypothetical protein [Thiolapillus sp.]